MIGWAPKKDEKEAPHPPPGDWTGREPDKRPALAQACQAINAEARQTLARQVLARRHRWLAPLERDGRARRLRLVARTDAVLWLASPSPLEVGLALHHVYGFPILPGSALKGLALRVARARGVEAIDRRYGTTDRAGAVAFLDGLPVERWSVGLDVMTPHFGKWYRDGRAPDDTESPVPVNFLSIARDSAFEVALVARHPEGSRELEAAASDLEQGLDDLGLGAKTAAGYGVFAVKTCPPLAPSASDRASHAARPAEPRRSAQASATLAQIGSLMRSEVKGRLAGILETIDRCPEGERPELRARLRQHLRELGLKDAEVRELETRHPRLREPA
jgi:CRISPR-associated protein Cmr6